MYVDTIQGVLSYAKNGKWLGKAFEKPKEFTDGDLYAAVSHCYDHTFVEILSVEILRSIDFY